MAAADGEIDVVDAYARPIAAHTATALFGIRGSDERHVHGRCARDLRTRLSESDRRRRHSAARAQGRGADGGVVQGRDRAAAYVRRSRHGHDGRPDGGQDGGRRRRAPHIGRHAGRQHRYDRELGREDRRHDCPRPRRWRSASPPTSTTRRGSPAGAARRCGAGRTIRSFCARPAAHQPRPTRTSSKATGFLPGRRRRCSMPRRSRTRSTCVPIVRPPLTCISAAVFIPAPAAPSTPSRFRPWLAPWCRRGIKSVGTMQWAGPFPAHLPLAL